MYTIMAVSCVLVGQWVDSLLSFHHIPKEEKQQLWLNGRKEILYLTTHSTHFIYGYMASDIWLRTLADCDQAQTLGSDQQ